MLGEHMGVQIGLIFAAVAAFTGIVGWLLGRDKRIAKDAEWRGQVTAKLDMLVGIQSTMARIDAEVGSHGERISAVESSAKQAHHRIDEINKKIGKKDIKQQ